MKPLYEEYRPRTWSELVGQDAAVRKIDVLRHRGLLGRAFWIVGASGTGKTSLARLIAEEIAEPWAITEIDAQDLNFETIRNFERCCRMRPIDGRGWVFIINECYGTAGNVIRRLQTVLEDDAVQKNSTWLFTGTPSGEAHMLKLIREIGPFLSSCIRIELADGEAVKMAFAERCRQVAAAAGMDGRPPDEYRRLAEDCNCNLRAMLQRVDAGEMLEAPSH